MLKRIGLLLALFAGCVSTWAQQVEGIVIDEESAEGIPYATVFIPELKIGVTADEHGHFKIRKLPVKELTIQFSALGFEPKTLTVKGSASVKVNMAHAHFDLDEMVVVSPLGRLVSDNVARVEQAHMDELEVTGGNSLADAMRKVPGLNVVSTGASFAKPVIRGLSGNRIVTISQGTRLENQQWGGDHGLGLGTAGIERLEIIKGPASMQYGSDAMGGVIYLVEERYADQNSLEGFVQTVGHSNLGTTMAGGIKVSGTRLKLNLFNTTNLFTDYKDGEGHAVENSRYANQTTKAALGYNSSTVISNFRYSYNQQWNGLTEGEHEEEEEEHEEEEAAPNWFTAVEPFQYNEHHMATLDNTFLVGKGRLRLALGYQLNERQEFEHHEHGEDSLAHEEEGEEELAAIKMILKTYTGDLNYHQSLKDSLWSVLVGSQWMIQYNRNSGQEQIIPNTDRIDGAIYGTLQRVTEKTSFQLGIRHDYRSIRPTHFVNNPELNVITREWNFQSTNASVAVLRNFRQYELRASASTGFRAPNTSELFSNGVHHGAARFEIGNEALNTERNIQVDLGLESKDEHFSFYLTPYVNMIGDYIYLSPADSSVDGFQVFNYEQANGVITGGEGGIHLHPHPVDWLHIESGISIIQGSQSNGDVLPMMPANRWNTTLRGEWKMDKWIHTFQAFVEHSYSGARRNVAPMEWTTPDYHLLHLGVAVKAGSKIHPITFALGVRNLLNEEYANHLSRYRRFGISDPGRNIFLNIKIPYGVKFKSGDPHLE